MYYERFHDRDGQLEWVIRVIWVTSVSTYSPLLMFPSQWRDTYQSNTLFFFFLINLFIYLFIWLRWVFVAVHGLSIVSASRGYSSLRCTGFSLQQLLLLWSTGSRCVGFSSCGSRAQLLCGMWDLPGPGLEPVSPALAGRFLTTVQPGKFPRVILLISRLIPTLLKWAECVPDW